MHSFAGMVQVQPFKALRFDPSRTPEKGIAPDEALTAPDPRSVIERWRGQGLLVEEPSAMYVLEIGPERYRREPMRFLLAAASADEATGWLPLERTIDIERSSPLPIPALAADDHGYLRTLLDEIVQSHSPDLETHHDGRSLRLWRIEDAGHARRLRRLLEEVPIRPCAALPKKGRALLAVAPLSEPGLNVQPVHRAIRGVTTFEPDRFLALVKDYARIYPLDRPLDDTEGLEAARERLSSLSHGHHALLFVLPGGDGRILRFRQAMELSQVPAVPRNPTLRSLDLALLNALVLRTVLGLQEPDRVGHPNIFGINSLEQLVGDVNAGTYQAGFALNPPPVWELRAVIEAQQMLPPNTLQLSPLPPAGLLYLSPSA